jgi:hypothetical protein
MNINEHFVQRLLLLTAAAKQQHHSFHSQLGGHRSFIEFWPGESMHLPFESYYVVIVNRISNAR